MKRIVAAPLWFLVGWYLGSASAWALGLGPLVAPIAAMALAAFVVADPRRIIWDRHVAPVARLTARKTASVDAHTI